MLTYEYHVYAAGVTISTFSTDAPLPHIQAGHFLRLETRESSTTPGSPLEIARVEVAYTRHPKFQSNPPKIVVSVHCREMA